MDAIQYVYPVPQTAAGQRAREILARLNDAPHPCCAEIGVFAADLSLILLAARPDLTLLMVDPWETLKVSEDYKASQDFHTNLTVEQQSMYRQISKLKTEFARHRRQIEVKHSVDCASEFEDEQFDLVFIDGDHSYKGCKEDIEAWWPLVKKGGWLSGHDYDHPKFPFGVKQAVDEWAEKNGHAVELGENYTWFVKK